MFEDVNGAFGAAAEAIERADGDVLPAQRTGFPLAIASTGEKLVITDMYNGRNYIRKMMDIGLRPGMRITVLRGGGRGPLLILAGETRIGLGHGMAEKIEVVPATDQDPITI